MFKRMVGLLFMISCGVVVYVLFHRPEFAAWKEAFLALLNSLSK